MEKASVRIALGIVFLILFTINAYALTCNDTSGIVPAGATVVLQMSTVDNAHAEVPGGTNYTRKVYCQETGVTLTTNTTLGPNTLVKLSAATNAHAQVSSGVGYSNIISLIPNTGTITVAVVTGGTPCVAPAVAVFRMSDVTDAHVQSAYNNVQPAYPVTICASFTAGGGGPPAEDILNMQSLSGSGIPVPADATGTVNIPIDNKVFGKPGYTGLESVLFTYFCDTTDTFAPNGKKCSDISNYIDFQTELAAFAVGNPSLIQVPARLIVTQLDDANPATTSYNAYKTFYQAKGAKWFAGPNPFTNATITPTYTIDPTALGIGVGSYKFFAFTAPADYIFQPNPETFEAAVFLGNNFQLTPFDVTPASGGGGPSSGGNGGDVYVIKDIEFPNIYRNDTDPITANITIQDLRTDLTGNNPPGTPLKVIVRDSKGATVGVFTPAQFGIGNYPTDGSTYTVPIEIEAAAAASKYLNIGETYTLYAKVDPYVESPVSGTDDSESVTGNNSSFKTFTVVNPQDTVNVPDAPWWMSLIMAGIVMGWMFFSARKDSGNTNSG